MGKAINIAGGTLTAKDHAVINHCIKDNSIGIGAGFGNEMAHRLDSVNELTILDGFAMIQGRCYVIYPGDEETLIIRSGSQGMKRHDLVVLEFDNALEKLELKVLEGVESSDPVDPEITQDDTLGGGNLYQMPLYRVVVDGLNVTIEDMREYMGSAVGKNVDLSVTTFNTPNVSFMVEDGTQPNTIKFTNGVNLEGGGFVDTGNLIGALTVALNEEYEIPADCWAFIFNTRYANVFLNSVQLFSGSSGSASGAIIIPLKKGDILKDTHAAFVLTMWGVKN